MSYSSYYQHFRFRVGDSLFNIDLFIECNERKLAISTKKNIFILSDVAVTYQQAEEKCQLYGGEIVQIDRNQRWSYTNFLNRNRIPDDDRMASFKVLCFERCCL